MVPALNWLMIGAWGGCVFIVNIRPMRSPQPPNSPSGYHISFNVMVIFLRSDIITHLHSVEFIDLSSRSFDLLNHFSSDLVRGNMATIDDMICRTDVPVTPIPTEPDANSTDQIPLRRWPKQTLFMSSFYLIVGALILLYLTSVFYKNIIKLEVTSSVISSKLQTINKPIAGAIVPIDYKLGQQLIPGQAIFRIKNSAMQRMDR